MMLKTKRAAAAAACVAGATLGVIGMSGPAFATGTGTATYNCSYVDPSTGNTVTMNGVTTTWQHGSSGNLTIKSNIPSPQPIAAGGIYTVVNGVTVANNAALATNDLVNLGPANVSGSVSAPSTLTLQIVGPPAVTVTCTLVSSSGFPI